MFGGDLKARHSKAQRREAAIGCHILNRMAEGGGRCYDRVRQFLREKDAAPDGKMQDYPADRGPRKWEFQWWNTPWGRCRIGKMHTQPSYWSGSRAAEILTKEICRIAGQTQKALKV